MGLETRQPLEIPEKWDECTVYDSPNPFEDSFALNTAGLLTSGCGEIFTAFTMTDPRTGENMPPTNAAINILKRLYEEGANMIFR